MGRPHRGSIFRAQAAFWNHTHVLPWLLNECKIDPNGQVRTSGRCCQRAVFEAPRRDERSRPPCAQDYNGDTALHDVARFGHLKAAALLLNAGADPAVTNAQVHRVFCLRPARYSRPLHVSHARTETDKAAGADAPRALIGCV